MRGGRVEGRDGGWGFVPTRHSLSPIACSTRNGLGSRRPVLKNTSPCPRNSAPLRLCVLKFHPRNTCQLPPTHITTSGCPLLPSGNSTRFPSIPESGRRLPLF